MLPISFTPAMLRTLASLVVLLFSTVALAGPEHDHDGNGIADHGPEAHQHAGHSVHSPSHMPDASVDLDPAADEAFAAALDLTPLSRATVQHNSTLKTLDTFARWLNSSITGRGTVDGQDPLYTVLDFAYRPRKYVEADLIKIRHLPLREDIADALGLTGPENADARHQFLKTAKMSIGLYESDAVQQLLERIETRELHKADAVQKVRLGGENLKAMMLLGRTFPPIRVVPPASGRRTDAWSTPDEIEGNSPSLTQALQTAGLPTLAPKEGYSADQADPVAVATIELRDAWLRRDAEAANRAVVDLAAALEAVNPAAYPSATKRVGEVVYNRLFKLTLPGAALYFVAFALFLVAAYSETPRARLWGLRFFVLGFLVHTVGIGVRWWLVEKSTDDLFHAIPIKNQFESVMFSAWFGALVGLLLELRRRVGSGGLFGAAAAFVGWLSLLAIFAAPYVFGRDIGGEIGQASGILMSYWLYIHVTTVCASYALIGMNFLLSIWWLAAYLRDKGQTTPSEMNAPADTGGILTTLGQIAFLPVGRRTVPAGQADTSGAFTHPPAMPRSMASRLDAANLVVLQLAFWILGAGIVFGAVWADMSWGRPWGWDPKETFALVTWIVYLGILHVRLVTKRKAFWTAVLCVIGFFIMLFNWIGVNFFLVGLHSYA